MYEIEGLVFLLAKDLSDSWNLITMLNWFRCRFGNELEVMRDV